MMYNVCVHWPKSQPKESSLVNVTKSQPKESTSIDASKRQPKNHQIKWIEVTKLLQIVIGFHRLVPEIHLGSWKPKEQYP